MKLIIHDLKEENFKELFPSEMDNVKILSDDETIKNCIGCFACWVKMLKH